ncbi:DNA polymerase IV (family X), NT domain [Halogranum tailed virus 1]|uniref:DNA polymerase IV (Family X), NT domain n=1 Tax=Halogranum tailed virus 1 TaxID=1273749 RepID=R4TGZ1_9CAUD|nr:DNA polymerase IV (family X), NT domain [Halogranum tailed virus 1]AGM11546.1 DNA polymerase IV (family X), NT domain [Halogranum tailed virus 1]
MEVVRMLERYQKYLKADGRSGKAQAVGRAAQSIREADSIPPNPAELDGVGPALRDVISDYQIRGRNDELERLKREYPYLENLTRVNGIGPEMAKRIHEECNVSKVSELIDADLESVYGIGDKTANKIRGSARRQT